MNAARVETRTNRAPPGSTFRPTGSQTTEGSWAWRSDGEVRPEMYLQFDKMLTSIQVHSCLLLQFYTWVCVMLDRNINNIKNITISKKVAQRRLIFSSLHIFDLRYKHCCRIATFAKLWLFDNFSFWTSHSASGYSPQLFRFWVKTKSKGQNEIPSLFLHRVDSYLYVFGYRFNEGVGQIWPDWVWQMCIRPQTQSSNCYWYEI